jgi:hypothetical protein
MNPVSVAVAARFRPTIGTSSGGPSNFDVPNTFAATAVWTLPFDKAWSNGPKRLTRGWDLIPVINYRSGLPLNVKAGLSASGTKPGPSGAGDENIVQADLVSSSVQTFNPENFQSQNGRSGNFFFNPADFSTTALKAINTLTNPASASYGSLGRNAFRGPDLINFNLSMRKTVSIYHERAYLAISADFFNILNHTEFQNPSTSITSSLFGQISTTNPARVIQLAARFSF